MPAYGISIAARCFMSLLSHTPGPYGGVPLSSLLCRTLWKSYLFNCRTKLAKLLCLKCFGRICFVNFSFCAIVSLPSIGLALYHDVPPGQQNSRPRYPIARHSHPVGSPASCQQPSVSIPHRFAQCLNLLVQLAHLYSRKSDAISHHNGSHEVTCVLTKSLELLAAWPP